MKSLASETPKKETPKCISSQPVQPNPNRIPLPRCQNPPRPSPIPPQIHQSPRQIHRIRPLHAHASIPLPVPARNHLGRCREVGDSADHGEEVAERQGRVDEQGFERNGCVAAGLDLPGLDARVEDVEARVVGRGGVVVVLTGCRRGRGRGLVRRGSRRGRVREDDGLPAQRGLSGGLRGGGLSISRNLDKSRSWSGGWSRGWELARHSRLSLGSSLSWSWTLPRRDHRRQRASVDDIRGSSQSRRSAAGTLRGIPTSRAVRSCHVVWSSCWCAVVPKVDCGGNGESRKYDECSGIETEETGG